MPLTRSATSGNKKTTQIEKKTTSKAVKRNATKDVDDVPPQKTIKKAANGKNNEENVDKKVVKSKKTLKKEDEQPEETIENEESDDDSWKTAETIYEFVAKDIQGNEVSLEKYKGHVCVIVNVASRCGHTKSNYEQFVEIFDLHSNDKGLKILAFPCNQFGKQEPGDNDNICEFAKKRNVKFDMFEKIDVNGKEAHPLWKFLTNQIDGPKGKAISWNFTKFIINKEGKVVERHASAVKPLKLVESLQKYW